MAWRPQTRNLTTASIAVAGILSMMNAFAAPPAVRPQAHMQFSGPISTPRLDLRVPSHLPEAAQGAERNFGAFPSRRQSLGSQDALQLPALGVDGVRARPTIQEFVRRVHQEGLPVARIFEGKSALVHLGLNPKGKPGLWLVQKTR